MTTDCSEKKDYSQIEETNTGTILTGYNGLERIYNSK
jgi:hypothetical protein